MQHSKEIQELNPLPMSARKNTAANDLNDADLPATPKPPKGSLYANSAGADAYYTPNNRLPPSPAINKLPAESDKFLSHFAGQRQFVYANIPEFHVDTRRVLTIALLLYLLEYLLIFGFQLGSYLRLHDDWHNAHWVLGLMLLIGWLLVSLVLIFLVGKRFWVAAFIAKALEFALHFVLLGWCVGYLEFAFLSFSYMMVFDILLLLFWVP